MTLLIASWCFQHLKCVVLSIYCLLLSCSTNYFEVGMKKMEKSNVINPDGSWN